MSTEKTLDSIFIVNEYSVEKKDSDKFLVEIQSLNRFFVVNNETVKLLKVWSETNCLVMAANILFDKNSVDDYVKEFKKSSIFQALSQKHSSRDRSLQNYLKFKQIIFKEDLTIKISKLLQRLINPIACIVFFLVFLLIVYVNFVLFRGQENSFSPPKTFWFIGYFLLMILFHEFGHLSALHKFTKKSSYIGFGIYLLRPVLFADVTKAWALDKYKRIVINISGIYFEFIFLIITSLIFLNFSISINNLIILFFVRCLYNLNPFFRSDGYWVISDFFEIPNLRLKSNRQLKSFFFSKGRKSGLNVYLILYSFASYLLMIFIIFKIVSTYFYKILDFPNNVLKLLNNEIGIDLFVEENFVTLLIYLFVIYLILGKILKLLEGWRGKVASD